MIGIGKTQFAIKKAVECRGCVISADAFQIYRGIHIATAKPSNQQREPVPHHLIDIKYPTEQYSVVEFLKRTYHIAIIN